MSAPSVPTGIQVVAGNKSVQVKWGKPNSNGGKAISGYIVKTFLNAGNKFLKQTSVSATTFSHTVTNLDNGTSYYFEVIATNKDGNSSPATSSNISPAAPPPSVTITITKIGPDKIPNRRAGQSTADAPKVAVTGTNLSQPWAQGAATSLQWVLYTSTAFTTVVGTDDNPLATNVSATGMSVSSPLAPPAAHADSNHLIGPWRLKATYLSTPDDQSSTAHVFSPAIYTTEVGSVIIGTASPNPMHDGDTVTVTGPDLGICTQMAVEVGGNTINVPLTRVDQNTATFVMPTFGFAASAGGSLNATYVLNGHTLTTGSFPITWDPLSGGSGDTGTTYTPPAAAPVGEGDYGFPLLIHRWKFTDPDTGDTYEFTRNPAQMTSPFATRQITSKHASAITGKTFLYEGSPVLANWQFGGIVKNAAAYETLRHWVEDRNNRTIVEDHFGRQIECVLLSFDAKPHNDSRRYWSHDYTISALVLNVGAPTEVPAP